MRCLKIDDWLLLHPAQFLTTRHRCRALVEQLCGLKLMMCSSTDLNVTINRLGSVQMTHDLLLPAGLVWQQLYELGKGPADSVQVYLAALKIPGGIGASRARHG